jgi:hypothetical protein
LVSPVYVLVFVLFFVFDGAMVVVVFEGHGKLRQVESFRRGFDVADDVGGVGLGVEAAGVIACELEAVEQGGSAFDVELAGGESVDDDGERDLNGLAVFEGGEFDMLAGDEVAAGGFGMTEGGVALMEAMVEVTPVTDGKGRGFAASSVGLDVSTA